MTARIDKLVQEGFTDPTAIRAKVGILAMSRIEAALDNPAV